MGIGHIAVKAGVHRGRARVETEDAVAERPDHLVLVGKAPVDALQRLELVEVEGGESVEGHRAEVAARALDPEHRHRLAGERVLRGHLGGRVAAAEVGDPEVRAQQIGAVEEQARLVESRGVLVVPEGREDLVHGETCSGEGQTESIMIAPNARIIDRC